jgi:hypothetical protein
MSNKENNCYSLVKVYVRLNSETLDEFRILNPGVIVRMRKICGWRYPCAVYLLPADEARDFIRLQEAEVKQEQRRARCLQSDGNGGYIWCNEKNRCQHCQKAGSFSFDNGHPTSLDALHYLYDMGWDDQDWLGGEPSDLQEPFDCSDLIPAGVHDQISIEIEKRLTAIRPKYGAIFAECLKGNTRPLNIARALGLGKSQVYQDIPKVMEAARKLYYELVE